MRGTILREMKSSHISSSLKNIAICDRTEKAALKIRQVVLFIPFYKLRCVHGERYRFPEVAGKTTGSDTRITKAKTEYFVTFLKNASLKTFFNMKNKCNE